MQVNNQQAFTLFELLVVLAIIALGSAIILPSISSSDSKIFQAQLRELSAVLKYNRRHAVISGQIQLAQLFPYQDGQINKIISTISPDETRCNVARSPVACARAHE